MLSNKVNEIMTRDLITAPASSTIFEVIELMVAKDVGAIVITEDRLPVGIFTEKDVQKRVMNDKVDPKKTGIKKVMTSPIRSVPEDTHIIEALAKMYRSKFRHLLVREKKGKIVGWISMRQILDLAVALGQRLTDSQTVGDVISKAPVTIEVSQPIREAIDLMIKKDTGCIAVLDKGKLKGIFTERDVLRRVAVKGLDTRKTPVQEVMTSNLVTLPHTALIGRVLEEMHKRHFRHMALLGEQNQLAGIVSMRDVLKYAKVLDVDEKVRSTWKEIEEFWESDEHYTPG
ncbi:MAG TPA: CBS domain-containing protein [Candidatus Binatia bacterium]|jgi:CBS domain-containing protein